MTKGHSLLSSERRRVPRRRFVDRVVAEVSSTDQTDGAVTSGDVLNISPQGIALRIPATPGNFDAPEVRIRVRFTLGDPACDFDLTGSVRSIVPAGTEDRLILGVEFADSTDGRAMRARLAEVLSGRAQ